MIGLAAPIRAVTQRFAVPFLILLSLVFIGLGKADVQIFDRLRVGVADTLAPVLELVKRPVVTLAAGMSAVEEALAVYRENARLREENERLLQWQETARRLAVENAGLREMARLAPVKAGFYISAQVIADAGGAFVRNVLVRAGSDEGVARGQAAVAGEGLVGRVIEVGARASRILLLTDLNSRIPVTIEDTHERAVLAGDNSDRPRLLYLPANSKIKPGDHVVTAGSGGVFPPGLTVGTVASVDGGVVRIEPQADLSRLEFLRIIDFGLAGMLPQSAVPQPKPGRSARMMDPELGR